MPIEYKGYFIEEFFNGYTVYYRGDEYYFDIIEKAKGFIDSITE